jgi:post-segregation antitoxin (ccd killing protein)
MPRVNIWLPDELHRAAKELGLPVSELAQRAIASEVDRQRKTAALDAYLAELDTELGPASDEEVAEARAWVEQVTRPKRGPGKGRRSA